MTSWQFLRDDMKMDNDYLPYDYLHLEQRQLQNSVVEELSVKSKNKSRWQWAFGTYALINGYEPMHLFYMGKRYE